MSCDRRCFDKDDEYYAWEDCSTCPGRDDSRLTQQKEDDMGLLGDLFDAGAEFIEDAVEDVAEIVTKSPGDIAETVKKAAKGAEKGIEKTAKKLFED